MGKKTRAEEIASEEDEAMQAIARAVIRGEDPAKFSSVIADGSASFHDEIAASVKRGFLPQGKDHAGDLIEVASLALMNASSTYGWQMDRQYRLKEVKEASELLPKLKKFARWMTDYLPDGEDWYRQSKEYKAAAGMKDLITYLDDLIAHAPDDTWKGDRTDHFARDFFTALEKWWDKNASRQHGSVAARNRVASILWRDRGRKIDGGELTDEEWAKGQFALNERNRSRASVER